MVFTDEACCIREIFNSHVLAEANPPAASVHCHRQRFVVNFWAGIVNDLVIGPYLLPRRLSAQITMCFWRKSYQKCWEEIPLLVRRRGSSTTGPRTSHRQLRLLDRKWGGQWLGLPDHRTSHQWAASYVWGHIKALILHVASWFWGGSYFPYCWGSSNLTLLSTHVSLSCVVVSCVRGRWP
jgi:hypothetical protein